MPTTLSILDNEIKNTSVETTTKPQPVLTDDALTTPQRISKKITAFVDHPSE